MTKFLYNYKNKKSFTSHSVEIDEKYKSNSRIYTVSEEFFNNEILPSIKDSVAPTGRPSKVNYYIIFNAILYVLRTGIAWRDIPEKYFGVSWHTIYTRFQRGNEKNIWWKLLLTLQNKKKLTINITMCDSTSFKIHRQGGGLKKRSTE